MEYTINRTKRNFIIISSVVLILNVLTIRLFSFFCSPTSIDTVSSIILKASFLIPLGYIMFVFFGYFRHYRLKVLQILVLIVFIIEVIFRSGLLSYQIQLTWEKVAFLTITAIWIIAAVILVIFLFQRKMKNYPGILSIRKYIITIILLYVLIPAIPLFLKQENIFAKQQLFELASIIPYIFTIEFAMKLYLKE